MVEYEKVDLSNANVVQRYFGKQKLDKWDLFYLFLFVLAYFIARPSISKGIKWWMSTAEQKEGEKTYAEYMSKTKIGNIRDGNNQAVVIPESSANVATSSSVGGGSKVSNRKTKDKSETEKLMDWDDEPMRKPVAGDQSDVVAWLDRWSKDEE